MNNQVTCTSDCFFHRGSADSLFQILLPYHIITCASVFYFFFYSVLIMLLYFLLVFTKKNNSHESVVFGGCFKIQKYYVMQQTRK